MKNIKSFLLLLTIALSLGACKQKISYTRDVLKRYHLTESEIDKLQYYLTNDVVIYNASTEGSNTSLVDGEIVVNEEKSTDKIIFRSGTKGILEKSISENKIAIRFENGEGKTLIFGSSSMKGRYSLQAEKWNPNGQGQITYGGEKYFTSKYSKNAYIQIKLRRNSDKSNSQRVVKGKKLKKG
jgi:hypothetical protein